MGQPAARVGDTTSHGTPLGPGPGCPTVMIGGHARLAGDGRHARLPAARTARSLTWAEWSQWAA